MPQFDIFIMSSQVIWLIIKFGIFYFFILKTFMVKISETIKFRNKLLKLKSQIKK